MNHLRRNEWGILKSLQTNDKTNATQRGSDGDLFFTHRDYAIGYGGFGGDSMYGVLSEIEKCRTTVVKN